MTNLKYDAALVDEIHAVYVEFYRRTGNNETSRQLVDSYARIRSAKTSPQIVKPDMSAKLGRSL